MFKLHPIQAAQTLFGYHAASDKKRRTAPRSTTKSEDKQLDTSDRRKVIATAREQRRNFVLPAWMVRQHCDFVTRFEFQAGTEDETFNKKLEKLVKWRSRAKNWDVTARHNRHTYMRIAEACRAVDGDIGNYWLRDGHLQGIESDRIAKPNTGNGLPDQYKKWALTHGVHLATDGRPLHYCVCKRDGSSGLAFARMVRASRMRMVGYYERFDQTRGISPLASAINHMQDLYESFEYAHNKIKIHQAFGLFIKRASAAVEGGDGFEYTDADDDDEATDNATTDYNFDVRPGIKMEGEPGDEIDVIESKSPAISTQEYWQGQIRLLLLSLDIPFTFFDVLRASYAGQKMDFIRYEKSVIAKQEQWHEFLMDTTAWDIQRWAALPDPEEPSQSMLVVPDGMKLRDIEYDWIPSGIPWLDKAREVGADGQSVALGLETRDSIIRRRTGKRYNDVIVGLGKEEQAAADAGATIAIGQPGQGTADDSNGGEDGSKDNE